MKLLRIAMLVAALNTLAVADSVQIQIRLTYDDGSPFRAGTGDGNAGGTPASTGGSSAATTSASGNLAQQMQIRVQVLDEAGSAVREAYPDNDGRLKFSVEGTIQTRGMGLVALRYRVRITGPEIDELVTESIVPAQGDRFLNLTLHRKAQAGDTPRKTGASMVSALQLNIPEKAKKEWEKGNSALTASDLKGAAEHFQKAIEFYPDYDWAYNNLGVVLIQQGDIEGGRRNFQKAVALNDHFARAFVNLGKLAIQEKKYAEADGFLHKSLQSDPTNPEAVFFAAEAALLVGHFDDCATDVRVLHTLPHEKYALGHYIAAKALEQENKAGNALAEYQLFLKEAPNSPQADSARHAMQTLQAQMSSPGATPPPQQ